MQAVRVTFKPTNTTIEFFTLVDAAKTLGIGDSTIKAWLIQPNRVPPYLSLERISRPPVQFRRVT